MWQEELPKVIGPYLVVEELGRGGMGIVLRALDPRLRRDVAIKIVRGDDFGSSREARIRFLREARSLARLNHPNVLPVYSVHTVGDRLAIAMEYVEGKNLSQWLEEPRETAEILRVFVAAARGLEASHSVGIVHRDFKPANVMVGDDGRVRVLDFGIARLDLGEAQTPMLERSGGEAWTISDQTLLTAAGDVVGTPRYMAPEQHAGKAVDPRTDQYAFCVSLYEALVGRSPWGTSVLGELARLKQYQKIVFPTDAAVPRHLRRALQKGLEPRPERRWHSMGELIDALESRDQGYAVKLGGGLLVVLFGLGLMEATERDPRVRDDERCESGTQCDGTPSLETMADPRIEAALAEARQHLKHKRFEAARTVAKRVLAEVEKGGPSAMLVDARHVYGQVLLDAGREREAVELLEAAYFEAAKLGDDLRALEVVSTMLFIQSAVTAHLRQIERWDAVATALEVKLGPELTTKHRAVLEVTVQPPSFLGVGNHTDGGLDADRRS